MIELGFLDSRRSQQTLNSFALNVHLERSYGIKTNSNILDYQYGSEVLCYF